jgi:hypothetical protein
VTKDEAQAEALRRWHALPAAERQDVAQAQIFAASLAEELEFRTMGNERKVIAAWLVRDLEARRQQDEAEPEHREGAD